MSIRIEVEVDDVPLDEESASTLTKRTAALGTRGSRTSDFSWLSSFDDESGSDVGVTSSASTLDRTTRVAKSIGGRRSSTGMVIAASPGYSGTAREVRQSMLEVGLRTHTPIEKKEGGLTTRRPSTRTLDFYMPGEVNALLEDAFENNPEKLEGSTYVEVEKRNVMTSSTEWKAPRILSNRVNDEIRKRDGTFRSFMKSQAAERTAQEGSSSGLRRTQSSALVILARECGIDPGNVEETSNACPKKGNSFLFGKVQRWVIAEPSLIFATHGEPWHHDIFTLYHNAVRKEMMDLYYMIGSMSKRRYFLELKELSDFIVWCKTFRMFMIELFKAENDLIFPWIGETSSLVEFSDAPRRKKQAGMVELLDSVVAMEEKVGVVPSGEVFGIVLDKIECFSREIVPYFAMEVKEAGPMIQRTYGPEDMYAMEHNLVRWISRREPSHALFIFLVRWMGPRTAELKHTLEKHYLSRRNRFSASVRLRKYNKAKQILESDHFGILPGYYDRWRRFEEEGLRRGIEQLRLSRLSQE